MLSRYVGASKYKNQGQRVVAGQRLMQAASDIFLGWQHTEGEATLDGRARDFYVRQLRDWKFSLPVEALIPEGMRMYGALCGWTLARTHARSGDRIAIAPTWAARTCSTGPSPSSPWPTPTRTSVTTRLWSTP